MDAKPSAESGTRMTRLFFCSPLLLFLSLTEILPELNPTMVAGTRLPPPSSAHSLSFPGLRQEGEAKSAAARSKLRDGVTRRGARTRVELRRAQLNAAALRRGSKLELRRGSLRVKICFSRYSDLR